jgi:hypothetical protein
VTCGKPIEFGLLTPFAELDGYALPSGHQASGEKGKGGRERTESVPSIF